MKKLKSIDEFYELKNHLIARRDPNIPVMIISAGTCGQASGANDIIRIAKRELLARELMRKVHLRITGCHGFCEMEPSVLVDPGRIFYPKVSARDMIRIVESVAKGEVVEDLLFLDPETGVRIEKQEDLPFITKQVRTILSCNEKVDPIRIHNYVESGGYSSLAKVLKKGESKWVVEEIKASGLRGRGGAGFPTGLKWEMLAAQPDNGGKIIVCNADEGDPGAYMDRSVLEGNPHSIIEGMIIGAYGSRATEGIVYVRNEYPLAIKHLVIALRQARELGLLGKNILGSGFSFDIRLIRGAGAFVCGEETALMKSIEGKTGEPRQRPPFPIQKGVYGKPTVINNVETWANIPIIIKVGIQKFLQIGTKNNSGTKIFSLVGKVSNTGLVEVPMGTTFKEIVFDIGGGSVGRAKLKAVQTGGPSGGCIPVSKFDLPIDYDSLAEAGSIMGSGGMIVMDESTCMVDVARYFMGFLKDESCGKCLTCRVGTQRMYEILDDISKGIGSLEKLDLLEELANVVKDTTMCGLGQTASNPVLSTLRYFRDEYIEHFEQKKCRAGVCKDLVGAPCQSTCPLGTEAWRYVAHIARGEYEEAYRAIRDANPFPSVCARVCSHPCEAMCRAGTTGGQSVAIRALKRFITDRIDPSFYKPLGIVKPEADTEKVAVVGAGPAGLTAAHYLSLRGYKVTVFEKEAQPGGMLISGIPAYRMPRDTLKKEIDALLDENVTLKSNTALDSEHGIDKLFAEGFKAVFLAMGAHKSKLLNIAGEDLDGVYPAIDFLKAFNLRGETHASGRVGVIGGGDSAVDAARVALRQKDVDSVTVLYRRTRQEMPALHHEVDAAIDEGVNLVTLVSPERILSEKGRLAGVVCIKNELGEIDASGRRQPVPIVGSEYEIPLDTLIITIGDTPDADYVSTMGINLSKWGTIITDNETLLTNREGVFAGGDVVTGPNTVVEAIADGKKVAVMIDRYLRGESLRQPPEVRLPDIYIAPPDIEEEEEEITAERVTLPTIPVGARKLGYDEVELTLSVEQAIYEARRCMRCDLDFTRPIQSDQEEEQKTEGDSA